MFEDKVLSKRYIARDEDWVIIISPAERWYSEDIKNDDNWNEDSPGADTRATRLGNWIEEQDDVGDQVL